MWTKTIFVWMLSCLIWPLFCGAQNTRTAVQTTWNGLRFGMTAEEAKRQIAAFELRALDGKPGQYTLAPGYTLEMANGLFARIVFQVELEFNQSGLCRVTLKLQKGYIRPGPNATPEQRARASEEGVGPGLSVSYLTDEMYNALSAKYGRPVNSEGGCDHTSDAIVAASMRNLPVSCGMTWKDGGQQIHSY